MKSLWQEYYCDLKAVDEPLCKPFNTELIQVLAVSGHSREVVRTVTELDSLSIWAEHHWKEKSILHNFPLMNTRLKFKKKENNVLLCHLWHEPSVLWCTDMTQTSPTLVVTHRKGRKCQHNFSFTFPLSFTQTFWAMLVFHPPCVPQYLCSGRI